MEGLQGFTWHIQAKVGNQQSPHRRPDAGRDPYSPTPVFTKVFDDIFQPNGRGVWLPAFTGTTLDMLIVPGLSPLPAA